MTLPIPITKGIFEQLNRMLLAKAGQSEILKHSLEKGLGNEEALRRLLGDFLPRRYGIAKGKIVNNFGGMSRQLDVVIYDALRCPTLFVDENGNQVIPIEGVFGVIEVKSTLTSTLLKEAFDNLYSVYELHTRRNLSSNDLLTSCPPYLHVFAYHDKRRLRTIAKQFVELSSEYPVHESSSSYAPKSPGHKKHTGMNYLVAGVNVLNRGSVYHMLDGSVSLGDFGDYTLGMFLIGLVEAFGEIELPSFDPINYLNWVMVQEWRGVARVPYK